MDLEVFNFDKNGEPIDLSKVTLSEEQSREILEILRLSPESSPKPDK